jgi:hypothetical protein
MPQRFSAAVDRSATAVLDTDILDTGILDTNILDTEFLDADIADGGRRRVAGGRIDRITTCPGAA